MTNYTTVALTINLVLFLLMLILHLVRLFTGFNAVFGKWVVPRWVNAVAAIVLIVIIYLNYQAL